MITSRDQSIAIIGMACTFPGARNLRQYWENILNKVDAISEAPPDWEAELFFDPESEANDRTYCKRGGFLHELGQFAAADFGVMPGSVDGTEPDHFLALRAAGEALEDAGYRKNNPYRERTSVVIGRGTYVNRGNTTAVQHGIVVDAVLRVLKQLHPEHTDAELAEIKRRLKESLPPFHADTAAGLVPNIISGRIANRLDLMGPNYIVDAACASSLVAVDLAIQDLLTGRSDLALAGGVHASTTPVILIIFSHLKALSRKGQLRPFDSGADGTLLGEGVGMVALKRLADAERDGDRIYALIQGIGAASDGRALGLLAPRIEGEELALRRAYANAKVDPETVQLIEAHGTGTPVGDGVELEALNSVFGPRTGSVPQCALGSVKSMISHTMPAAGIAGLIKTALALHHKVLPPTLHCENPNPKFDAEKGNFYLNRDVRPWIHGRQDAPRRAGVNAFGFGGINAHAVLEEYTGPLPAPALQHGWPDELFVVSAPDLPALKDELNVVLAKVQTAAGNVVMKDLAWTLNCARPMSAVRLAIVASTPEDLAAKLEQAVGRLADPATTRIRDAKGVYYFQQPQAKTGKVAVIFPGEGAQYSGMLADLCVHFPEVRGWFDLMDEAFDGHARGYRLSDVVFPPVAGDQDRLFSMDIGAEAVFTANQALWTVLDKLEFRPDAMLGHSTGEHSALWAAGVVDLPTRAETLRHIRGVNNVFEELNTAGGISEGVLLAVAGASHTLLETLVDSREDLYFALDNCPHQVVLCGSSEAVDYVLEALKGKPAICQRLPMGRAYHTPLFDEFAERLRRHFETLSICAPRVPLYSCVTTTRYSSDSGEIRELASSQWASTVRFRETVKRMYDDGFRLFLECGPRGNLTAFVDDILRGKPNVSIPVNVRHQSGITQLHHALGMMLAHGVDLNLEYLYEDRAPAVWPPKEASRKPLSLKIAGGLQPLRLPADFPAARPASQGSPLGPATAASAISPSAPAPVSTRAQMMEQYFASMRQFLAGQQQVMSAYLKTKSGGGSAPVPPPQATPAARHPFVTTLLEHDSGERAVVRHLLSLDRDLLFADHTLGRDLSEANPKLKGIPVVPFTVTMEMMAGAGAVLMPGRVLTGMREVRGYRWITIEQPTEIEMIAERTEEPGAVRVRLRPVQSPIAGVVWAEGIMLYGDAYPAAPPARAARLESEAPSAWADDRLYRDGMFHGASFRAVRHMRRRGADGTFADLAVLSRQNLIAGDPNPSFLTDPVILDAAGQAVAFWSQEQLSPFSDIFPFRLAALHCYQPLFPAGSHLDCRVYANRITEMEIDSDIEIVDDGGKLVYRLESWMDRRFPTPRALWDLRISCGRTLIGRPWQEPVAAHPNADALACCLVDNLPSSLLEGSHGIWADMIAGIILGPQERRQWQDLQAASAKRRFDWLRGRCAAKDAVRLLVKQRHGVDLPAADVELIPDASGRPAVAGAWTGQLGIRPAVSISHTAESAVGLAALEPDTLVGIDLETAARSDYSFKEIAFDESERRLVESLAPAAQPEWFLRLWCAKEAAAKALGTGLDLKSLVVTRIEPDRGFVHLELRNVAARQFPHLQGQPVVACTGCSNGFVLSTVVNHQGAPTL